jgi:antitoxin component of MazEF toxin-antitoxin module
MYYEVILLISQIAKWGNSQGLRIDKSLLRSIGLAVGDKVEVIRNENSIILKPQQSHGIDWYLQDYERPDSAEWEEYNEQRGREEW